MSDRDILRLQKQCDELEKRVAALEARRTPTFADLVSRAGPLSQTALASAESPQFRALRGDELQAARDAGREPEESPPEPPAEKAEARTCAGACGMRFALWPLDREPAFRGGSRGYSSRECRAAGRCLNQASTPCAPAEDAVCESPHECAVSHDEAGELVTTMIGSGRERLQRYIGERRAAEKVSDERLKRIDVLMAEVATERGHNEQLRAEVTRLQALREGTQRHCTALEAEVARLRAALTHVSTELRLASHWALEEVAAATDETKGGE